MVNWPGEVVHHDAIASERAAFTFEELTTMLGDAGLTDLEHVCARPLGEYQVHWAYGRDRSEPVNGLWHEVSLPPGTELVTRIVLSSFPRELWRS